MKMIRRSCTFIPRLFLAESSFSSKAMDPYSDLSPTNRPVLTDGETLLATQAGVGLYQGWAAFDFTRGLSPR